MLAAASVNPLPDGLDDPRALALAKFEVVARSQNTERLCLGLDLVEVGDHSQNFVVLVLLHAFRDRLEKLAPAVTPAATALTLRILLAETGVRAVAVDGQIA